MFGSQTFVPKREEDLQPKVENLVDPGRDEAFVRSEWGEEWLPILRDNKNVSFGTDSISVKLRYPVKLESGVETQTIEIKEPRAFNLKAMDLAKGEIGKTVELLISCAGMTREAANGVSGRDLTTFGKLVAVFLGSGQKIGEI